MLKILYRLLLIAAARSEVYIVFETTLNAATTHEHTHTRAHGMFKNHTTHEHTHHTRFSLALKSRLLARAEQTPNKSGINGRKNKS